MSTHDQSNEWLKTPSGGQPVIAVGEPVTAGDPVRIEAGKTDLAELRERLSQTEGRAYWRSVEELAASREFDEDLQAEFPGPVADWDPVNRRDFLKLMGASLALGGMTACTKQPTELIVPYVKSPEDVVPGKPLYFATAWELGGYAVGVLAESHMGRPTKIEGNPDHPASLGGTDIFAQASVLGLYDPDRSQRIAHRGSESTWEEFTSAIGAKLAEQAASKGAGLRILTGTVTSPSLSQSIEKTLKAFSSAKWVQYDAATRDNERQGARMAFAQDVAMQYHFDKADVIVSLDADFLGEGAMATRYARDYSAGRRVEGAHPRLNRLYAVESTPTLTGSNAEHRLAIRASEVEAVARAIASGVGLGAGRVAADVAERHGTFIRSVIADLEASRGACVVVAGACQPPVVHALAHAITERLGSMGKTAVPTEPVESAPQDQTAALRDLAADINAGRVEMLLVLDANPAYDAPADLEFGERISKVGFVAHLGLYEDETAALSQWHIPMAHYLESWGDTRAHDGTVSIVQPLIQPLYGGKSPLEFMAAIAGVPAAKGYDLIRETWKARGMGGDFEASWRRALHDGIVPGTQATPKSLVATGRIPAPVAAPATGGYEINFRPDPCVGDGRFANIGWLQELPKPLTRLTWDNAALMSTATAEELGVTYEDVVELTFGGRTVRAPVWVVPGHADGAVTLHLGYGRPRAGRVASGVGVNAYALRTAEHPWFGMGLEVRKTGETYRLAGTERHYNIAQSSRAAAGRKLVRVADLHHYEDHPDFAQHMTHEPPADLTLYKGYDYTRGNQWGMTIDLNTCTGCSACVIACQAENNIPVVGKEEVGRGREMHWIRVDRYYEGGLDNPTTHHQPVTCMHCENAHCETVCPVGATSHSAEGLNQMVYNRCVGTRYCSNNCPYKVRRFNFFQYTDLETEQKKLLRNPDVTVRVRGVMEKCTYCVQRINHARIAAKKEGREIRDGEVVTACQQACPTKAITFGNIIDPDSDVAAKKASPLNYGILTDLNTKPRTTYLAKVRNSNPALEGASSGHESHPTHS